MYALTKQNNKYSRQWAFILNLVQLASQDSFIKHLRVSVTNKSDRNIVSFISRVQMAVCLQKTVEPS